MTGDDIVLAPHEAAARIARIFAGELAPDMRERLADMIEQATQEWGDLVGGAAYESSHER